MQILQLSDDDYFSVVRGLAYAEFKAARDASAASRE